MIGTYHKSGHSEKRRSYKKVVKTADDGIPEDEVFIQYHGDRWEIYDKGQNKQLAVQMTTSKVDVCLSDTMHIEWGEKADPNNAGNILSFTDKKVKHRCKGENDLKVSFFHQCSKMQIIPIKQN